MQTVEYFPTRCQTMYLRSPMVDTPLTTLELFLLNLVDQGLNTPYQLKTSAGLSVGAALPALNRLNGRKLLQRAATAARNKQQFEVTPLGKTIMTSQTKRVLGEAKTAPLTDTESALRLAALAFFSKKRSIAVSLLTKLGQSRRKQATRRAKDGPEFSTPDLPGLYRSLRDACEAARSDAEGEVLIALAGKLKKAKL
jgi:hypothetical protein